jgi:hypothetical protein
VVESTVSKRIGRCRTRILLLLFHNERLSSILTLSLVLIRTTNVMVQPKLSVMGDKTLLHGPLSRCQLWSTNKQGELVRNQLLPAVTLAIDEVAKTGTVAPAFCNVSLSGRRQVITVIASYTLTRVVNQREKRGLLAGSDRGLCGLCLQQLLYQTAYRAHVTGQTPDIALDDSLTIDCTWCQKEFPFVSASSCKSHACFDDLVPPRWHLSTPRGRQRRENDNNTCEDYQRRA